jgi:hypothetical protein
MGQGGRGEAFSPGFTYSPRLLPTDPRSGLSLLEHLSAQAHPNLFETSAMSASAEPACGPHFSSNETPATQEAERRGGAQPDDAQEKEEHSEAPPKDEASKKMQEKAEQALRTVQKSSAGKRSCRRM